jgi:hypothetical protein
MDANVANVLSVKLKEIFSHPFIVDYVQQENDKYICSTDPAKFLVAAQVALVLDASACPDALADPPLDLLQNMSLKVLIELCFNIFSRIA